MKEPGSRKIRQQAARVERATSFDLLLEVTAQELETVPNAAYEYPDDQDFFTQAVTYALKHWMRTPLWKAAYQTEMAIAIHKAVVAAIVNAFEKEIKAGEPNVLARMKPAIVRELREMKKAGPA